MAVRVRAVFGWLWVLSHKASKLSTCMPHRSSHQCFCMLPCYAWYPWPAHDIWNYLSDLLSYFSACILITYASLCLGSSKPSSRIFASMNKRRALSTGIFISDLELILYKVESIIVINVKLLTIQCWTTANHKVPLETLAITYIV